MKANMLKAQMALKGMNQVKLAAALEISPNALGNKLNGRSDFTRKEIGAMIRLLDIKDPMAIFFAEEVS
jgi:transcriptional regulator with XRE-family HTH domain